MKKFILIALATICLLCLAACKTIEQNNKNSSSTSQNENSTINEEISNSSKKELIPVSVVFTPPSKTEYVQGEDLITVVNSKITYNDESVKIFYDDSPYKLETNYNKDVPGEYWVKCIVDGLEPYEFNVTVNYKPAVVGNMVKVKINSQFNGKKGEVDSNGYSQYKNFTDAINIFTYANIANTVNKLFEISAGTYTEKVILTSKMANTTFIGAGENSTIISYGACSSTSSNSTDSSSTLFLMADNFTAKNITFENSYDYINGTESNKQAVAMTIEADKAIFENCTFLGYQDTLQAKKGRQYFKNCTIKGTTDFIFGGNATSVFDTCNIVTRYTGLDASNNGYITATKGNDGKTNGAYVPKFGFVFLSCTLTSENNVGNATVSLGRPWRADATVAYLNCEMGAHISKLAFGNGKSRYFSMNGGQDAQGNTLTNLPKNAYYYEYNNTGLGALTKTEYDALYNGIAEADRDFIYLSEAQANEYTLENIFAKNNGSVVYSDNFNPTSVLS